MNPLDKILGKKQKINYKDYPSAVRERKRYEITIYEPKDNKYYNVRYTKGN